MKLCLSIAALLAVLGPAAAVPQASGHVPGASLTGVGTPTIDGMMSPGEWDGAGRLEFAATIPPNDGGGTTPATLLAMNDGANLYLAVRVIQAGQPRGSFSVEFDNNHDGTFFEQGDDGFVANPGAAYFDFFRTTQPPCPPSVICGLLDTQVGGTSDGQSASAGSGGVIVYEVSKPIDSADDLHDFSLASAQTIGFAASIQVWSLVPACNFGPQCVAVTNVPSFGSGDITVASTDSTPPVLELPSDVSIPATNPNGAVVVYTASATDDVEPSPSMSCEPASGSTFPIGETTVECAATDAAGNQALGSFNVHVKGASEQVSDLLALLNSYDLTGLGSSLHDKLVVVQQQLSAGEPLRAEETLGAFIHQVNAQRGMHLTESQADELRAAAARMINVIEP